MRRYLFVIWIVVVFSELAIASVQTDCENDFSIVISDSAGIVTPKAIARVKSKLKKFGDRGLILEEETVPISISVATSRQTGVPILVVESATNLPFFFTKGGIFKPRPVTKYLTRFPFLPAGLLPFGFDEKFVLDEQKELIVFWDPEIEDHTWYFTEDGERSSTYFDTFSYGQLNMTFPLSQSETEELAGQASALEAVTGSVPQSIQRMLPNDNRKTTESKLEN